MHVEIKLCCWTYQLNEVMGTVGVVGILWCVVDVVVLTEIQIMRSCLGWLFERDWNRYFFSTYILYRILRIFVLFGMAF